MANEKVRVWDPLVRIFHWTLVVAFTVAYVTGEDAPPLHEWMGYVVLALVLFRIVWGFIGSERARFTDFVRGPGQVLANLRDIVLLRAKRYLGHSPAGGGMVVLLLAMLLATTVTGFSPSSRSIPLRRPRSWPPLWQLRTVTSPSAQVEKVKMR